MSLRAPPTIREVINRDDRAKVLYWNHRWRKGRWGSVGDPVRELSNTIPNANLRLSQSTTSTQPIIANRGLSFEGDDLLVNPGPRRLNYIHQTGVFTVGMTIHPTVDNLDRVETLFATNMSGASNVAGIWIARESRDGADKDNAFRVVLSDGDGNFTEGIADTDSLPADQTSSLIVTGDGSTMTGYVDGAEVFDESIVSLAPGKDSMKPLRVGARDGPFARQYTGQIHALLAFPRYTDPSDAPRVTEALT